MKIKETGIAGCYLVEKKSSGDSRGEIHEVFDNIDFMNNGMKLKIGEVLFSTSAANVLRGMHFQVPPKATAKLVTCMSGAIYDAVIDLRKKSPTYLSKFAVKLSEDDGQMLFIPEGLAHGYYSYSDQTQILYVTSGVFSPEHDSGISWQSVGIDWPADNPVISERDQRLAPLDRFDNPF